MVFQIQMSRSLETVPLIRDYITDADRQAAASTVKAQTALETESVV